MIDFLKENIPVTIRLTWLGCFIIGILGGIAVGINKMHGSYPYFLKITFLTLPSIIFFIAIIIKLTKSKNP